MIGLKENPLIENFMSKFENKTISTLQTKVRDCDSVFALCYFNNLIKMF